MNAPVMGGMTFDALGYRLGEFRDEEGVLTAITFEWWLPPAPWFRFRMVIGRLEARKLVQEFAAILDGETETTL